MFQASRTPSIAPSAFDLQEAGRLEALDRLDAIDMPRDETFDRIARLIKATFNVPIALVSVLDGHRQLFKASEGLGGTEVSKQDNFCKHVINDVGPMIVPDALVDARFAHNPHVLGEPYVRFYAGIPLRTSDGHNIGTICAIDQRPRQFSQTDIQILGDLAQLAMDQIELRQLANLDALTGILSRRAFRASLSRAAALAARHMHNLSVITFDLDHFKSINDTFGHPAGDEVLVRVAQTCLQVLRASDEFGRIGGEEFAVLLPHTDRRHALEAADKMREAVEALIFDLGGEKRQVTASFGIAELEPGVKDGDTLLGNADIALYEAKAGGRNRCIGWRSAKDVDAHPRRRVLKAGLITYGNAESTMDCTVRSLSDDGAGIDLSSSYGLPEKFKLIIRSDGTESMCRIVSKNERHVEVEFC